MHRFRLSFTCLLGALFASPAAVAQVTEPNGLAVPGPTNGPVEQSLQSYFDTLTPPESINAVAQASPQPGTFSPLCGFQAVLVLSQSGAAAGLSWYNVPASPTAKPAAVYQLIAETTMPGATVSSASIRNDPNYAGGLIGFALTKSCCGGPIYYSEYMRNVLCSGCVMPDYWKMMLAYPSTLQQNTYYLAFEDWEGANQTSWPDDGDFNDKVFKLTGVRCPGGGDACDTGQPGLCAQGVRECQSGGDVVCKAQILPTPEKCDQIDNDCNGMIDEGDVCQAGYVCDHGTCVRGCLSGEFRCPSGLVCDDSSHCVEAACLNVPCPDGKVCRGGACVAACDDITCPVGQVCLSGKCIDFCAGVTCDGGRVCRSGACVEKCDCAGCPTGLACNMQTGACVAPGCENVVCAAGMACVAGTCSDPCAIAKCPGGAACTNGVCEDPAPPAILDGGLAGDATIIIGPGSTSATSTAGGSSAGTSGANAATSAGATAGTGVISDRDTAAKGCNCRAAGAPLPSGAVASDASRNGALAIGAMGLAIAWRRRRRSSILSRAGERGAER